MKTRYAYAAVTQFLIAEKQSIPDTIMQLTEGHISQAFSYETDLGKFVLRIAPKQDDFLIDQYASDTYGKQLLVPEVTEIGKFENDAHYCISDFVEGKTVVSLNDQEMNASLPSIHTALAKVFKTDISNTAGYGHIDVQTGNAPDSSWKGSIASEIEKHGIEAFRTNAKNIGLDPLLIDGFFNQFRTNLKYTSEERRLLHGDPAFDNMLVKDSAVVAMLDWPQMGYGDWMSDFARLKFWWPDAYGEPEIFAKEFSLDREHIPERMALYWATNALWAIEFTDRAKVKTDWLHQHIAAKRI